MAKVVLITGANKGIGSERVNDIETGGARV